MNKTIGIIGFGNMGSAIAGRIKGKYKVIVFDKNKTKTKSLAGIKTAGNVLGVVENTDVVILAVKPQDLDDVLTEIRGYIDDKLVISIAAGIPIRYIENRLIKAPVVRVMPNLPIQIGKGMICLCKGRYTNKAELCFAQELFDNLGSTLNIKEGLMNAVTAISGSGPGYLYKLLQDKRRAEWEEYSINDFLPKLSLAAQSLGFTVQQAQVLSRATVQGSIALLKASGLSPERLCLNVASKGGTTEAGIDVLNKGGSLRGAVKAAFKRAKVLSRHKEIICHG